MSHITLAVRDLQRSFQFYHEVLGLKAIARWESGAYFLAGDFWFCISVDPLTRQVPAEDYTHVAFSVTEENFGLLSEKIVEYGCIIWKENTSPGDSLYFLDPDSHKLEIHSSDLQSRLRAWKLDPWPELEIF